MSAAYNDHMKVVKYLLANGADATLKNKHRHNTFIVAIAEDQLKIAEYIAQEKGTEVFPYFKKRKKRIIDEPELPDSDQNTIRNIR